MHHEARRHHAQKAYARLFPHVEMPGGIVAMVAPQSPERSIFNGVFYDDPSSVVDGWEALSALYADAGVRAWLVWVQPGDSELGRALGERGHVLDAQPEAMALALEGADLDGPDAGEPVGWEEMARLNELAYGLAPGSFSAVPAPAHDDLRLLGIGGDAVAGSLDVDGTATILFVATDPPAQGRGLGTALMKQLLRGARERGCDLSVLEASPAGRPVYERLGYRSLGTLEMWEHRTS